jgi:hypothetical protein
VPKSKSSFELIDSANEPVTRTTENARAVGSIPALDTIFESLTYIRAFLFVALKGWMRTIDVVGITAQLFSTSAMRKAQRG